MTLYESQGALVLIANRLKNINYAIIGSCNLALQNVNVQTVNDIDILTNKLGIHLIEKLLEEFVVENVKYVYNSKYDCYYAKFLINDIKVEVFAAFNNKQPRGDFYKDLSKKIKVKIDNIEINCLPLAQDMEFYTKKGKLDNVEKIKRKLMM